jgi:hypothetical protein
MTKHGRSAPEKGNKGEAGVERGADKDHNLLVMRHSDFVLLCTRVGWSVLPLKTGGARRDALIWRQAAQYKKAKKPPATIPSRDMMNTPKRTGICTREIGESDAASRRRRDVRSSRTSGSERNPFCFESAESVVNARTGGLV